MIGLQAFFGPRTFKLWGTTLKRGRPAAEPHARCRARHFRAESGMTLEVGDRTFELIHAPEGETEDNILVWMPKEKIVFTGNTFGPVWLSMPFLNTLRGDKPRLVRDLPQVAGEGARSRRRNPASPATASRSSARTASAKTSTGWKPRSAMSATTRSRA